MKKRQLNYAAVIYKPLALNPAHQFAASFALRIFHSNSIYSFIPKNACSTLRLSLALANGCISSPKDFNWIHQNNATFSADLASLILADYTFVILRCPYARLASAYLDKIVDKTQEAWVLYETLKRKTEIDQFSFKFFLKAISNPTVLNSNIHWRPQVDYLVYMDYDDYFSLEHFSKAIPVIEQASGIQVVDARPLTRHGSDRFVTIDDGNYYGDCLPEEIRALKVAGNLPSPQSLYDDEGIALVGKLYKKDIALYRQLFGENNMLPFHRLPGRRITRIIDPAL